MRSRQELRRKDRFQRCKPLDTEGDKIAWSGSTAPANQHSLGSSAGSRNPRRESSVRATTSRPHSSRRNRRRISITRGACGNLPPPSTPTGASGTGGACWGPFSSGRLDRKTGLSALGGEKSGLALLRLLLADANLGAGRADQPPRHEDQGSFPKGASGVRRDTGDSLPRPFLLDNFGH